MTPVPEGVVTLVAALERASAGKPADRLTFATEEEALAYATKLAHLKPGDRVTTKASDEEPRQGVFAGATDEGRRAVVFFYNEDSAIGYGAFPWGCLRVPA